MQKLSPGGRTGLGGFLCFGRCSSLRRRKQTLLVIEEPMSCPLATSFNEEDQNADRKLEKKDAVNNSPSEYGLSANYPNPFNPATQISYQLKDAGIVRLSVYDMLGREVALLVNQYQPSGYYSATWTAGRFSSGAYVYRISVKDQNGRSQFSETKRMMLVK
jgi:hypothetical protein